MKYELLPDDTIEELGHVLKRVRYLDSGKLGGYIESEKNLSQEGKSCVLDYARVYENAFVSDDAQVYDNACLCGRVLVSDDAQVYDNACLTGDVEISDKAQVAGNARVSDEAGICDNARASGDAFVHGNSLISDDAHISGIAETRGGWICSGLWKTSPLQIQGSKYFFNMAGERLIGIRCHIKTVEEWRDTYKEKFDELFHFTKEEQIEYILYLNLASTLYNFGFKLPLPGEE
jgi:carbonic anhydrase/acetyltransferase-like protein (isoleucine patch superfamily)